MSVLAGGNLAGHRPVFAADGRFFFVSCYHAVRVYSTTTAQLLTQLEHGSAVTSFAINPLNAFQLLTTAVDGRIRFWEYQEGKELLVEDFGQPIVAAVLAGDESSPALVLSCATNFSERDGHISAGEVKLFWFDVRTRTNTRSLYKGHVHSGPGAGVVVSHDSSCVAWIAGAQLFVLRVGVLPLLTGKKRKKGEAKPVPPAPRVVTHPRRLTAVAFHPTESTISTGDEEGAIVLAYLSPEFVQGKAGSGPPPSAKLHWHAHEVRSLAFSPDGTNLLSGGDEAVLVTWQLGTRNRSFLPRLGGSILAVATSSLDTEGGPQYALALSDNSISLASAVSGQVERSVRGVSPAAITGNLTLGVTRRKPVKGRVKGRRAAAFVFEPRRQLAVVQGRPGTLQFYDYRRDTHVADLEIVPYNSVHRGGQARGDGHGHSVSAVSFTHDGEWMLTVDHRGKGTAEIEAQTSIKFWKWHEDDAGDDEQSTGAVSASGRYVLDSMMDAPHKAAVTGLCRHPTLPVAVTTSMDFTFKVWALQDVVGGRGFAKGAKRKAWHCRSVGGYRECAARCAAFSHDGSLLAIGYQQVVTLWEPDTCTLQETLTHPPFSHLVTEVGFTGQGSARPSLVACSTEWVHVWNLLSCQVSWSFQLAGHALSVHPMSSAFAVASKHGIYVLDSAHSGGIPDAGDDTSAALVDTCFAPDTAPAGVILAHTDEDVSLLGFDPSYEVSNPANASGDSAVPAVLYMDRMLRFSCTTEAEPSDLGARAPLNGAPPSDERGALSALFGSSAPAFKPDAPPTDGGEVLHHTFDFAPESHAIPPISIISGTFLSSILRRCELGEMDTCGAEESEDEGDDDGDDRSGAVQTGVAVSRDNDGRSPDTTAGTSDESGQASESSPRSGAGTGQSQAGETTQEIPQTSLDTLSADSDYFQRALAFFAEQQSRVPARKPAAKQAAPKHSLAVQDHADHSDSDPSNSSDESSSSEEDSDEARPGKVHKRGADRAATARRSTRRR